MIYLYAISERTEAQLPDALNLEGVDGGPACLDHLVYQDIAAVFGLLQTAQVTPTMEAVWRHETVVEALMGDRAVLPMRFGALFADAGAVQAALAAHYDDLVADLRRVRGKVELGLRVLWAEDAPFPKPIADNEKSSGFAYMMARVDQERETRVWTEQAKALAAEIHDSLAVQAAESACQVQVTRRMFLTAAYLVEKDQVGLFRRQVDTLQPTYPTLRFLCTGPWPPYNFVTIHA